MRILRLISLQSLTTLALISLGGYFFDFFGLFDQYRVHLISQHWGNLNRNRSLEGNLLSVRGELYSHGLGTHAYSAISVSWTRPYRVLRAGCAVDDEAQSQSASVICEIHSAQSMLYRSPIIRRGDPVHWFEIPVKNLSTLELRMQPTEDGDSYDHADWLELTLR